MSDIAVATMNKKISAQQFFALLFIARIFVMLTYTVPNGEVLNSTDKIMHVAMSLIIFPLTLIPLYFFIKSNREASIIDRALSLSPAFAKVLSVGFCFLFFALNLLTSLRFKMFASLVMFPEANLDSFILIIFALVAYVAYLGIEAMGRAGSIFAIITIVSLLFACAVLTSDIDVLNYTPPFFDGARLPVKAALYSVYRSVDVSFLLIFAPKIKGNLKNGFRTWYLVFAVTALFVTSVLAGVLGEYGDTQLFQFFSIVAMGEAGIFQRLDALQTGVWILCAFVKMSVYVYLSYYVLNKSFKIEKKKTVMTVNLLICFLCMLFISADMKRFTVASNFNVMQVLYILFVILLPCTVLIAEKLKRRKAV